MSIAVFRSVGPRYSGLVFALLFAVQIGLPVSAQTGAVEGTVLTESGERLPGVNVVLTGTALGAATDLGGRYHIPAVPEGRYSIVASAVGFEAGTAAAVVSSGETTTVDFVLRERVLEYDAVVVTASRREQAASGVPLTVSLVTPRDIESRNLLDLGDVLRRVPGVQLADNTVNIRGSSGFAYSVGSRVLLLVDGNPMLGPDDGGLPFNLLPLSQIERVEVVKGPGSALYGGGALGGVINVITKDYPARPETDLSIYGGAYEPTRYDVWRSSWSGGDERRPFAGATATHARRLGDRAGFWTNVAYQRDSGFRAFSEYSNLLIHSKAGVRLSPSLKLDVFGGLTERRRELFIFWQSARQALRPAETDFLSGGQSETIVRNVSVLPTMTHIVGPRLFQTVRGRFFGVRVQPIDETGRIRPRAKWTVANRYGAEWQMIWNPAEGRYLTAGVTGDLNNGRSEFYSGTTDQDRRLQPEGAAFVQIESRAPFDLTVVGGLRYDVYALDTEETIRRASPKVNVSWAPADLLTVRASVGRGFRVPSVAERFVDNRDFFPVVSNLGLRPEQSTGYELGVKSLARVGRVGIVHVDAAAFWNTYQDLVEPKFKPEENAFQFVNLVEARIRGVDLEARLIAFDDLITLQAGYLYLDAADRTGRRTQELAYRSRHLVKLTSTFRPLGLLDFGIDVRYASRPRRLDSDFTRFVPDSDLMVAQRVVDLRAGIRIGRAELGLLLKNALDYYYVERPAILAAPRHALARLRLSL